MSFLFFLQAQSPNIFGSMLPLLLMFVVVFFFFIRPQAKKQKEQNKFLEALDKGEEVVTLSGLIGRINRIDGGIVTLAVNDKTFIRITKSSISKEMTEAYRKSEAAGGDASSAA
jgi:preprotein translocase subunit YajC